MARKPIAHIERFLSASLYGVNCLLASRNFLSIGSAKIISETVPLHRSSCFIFMSGKVKSIVKPVFFAGLYFAISRY